MKARIMITLFVLVVPALLISTPARASIESVTTVDRLFNALNTGEIEVSLATFASDAVVENRVRGETYNGAAEITSFLQSLQRKGRHYEIVRVEMAGNTISAAVEISDRGRKWATETITAQVSEGRLKKLIVSAIRLDL